MTIELNAQPRARTLRRRIVVVSLLGALLTVIALGLLATPHLRRAYYLWTIRREPELMEAWLLEAEANPQRTEALREFFMEPRGGELLFDLYLAEYDKRQWDQSTVVRELKHREAQGRVSGHFYLGQSNYGAAFRQGGRARQMYSTVNMPENADRRRAILAELDACVGRTFRVERVPRYEFHVEAIVDGEAKPPPWGSAPLGGLMRSRAHYVCYFRLLE